MTGLNFFESPVSNPQLLKGEGRGVGLSTEPPSELRLVTNWQSVACISEKKTVVTCKFPSFLSVLFCLSLTPLFTAFPFFFPRLPFSHKNQNEIRVNSNPSPPLLYISLQNPNHSFCPLIRFLQNAIRSHFNPFLSLCIDICGKPRDLGDDLGFLRSWRCLIRLFRAYRPRMGFSRRGEIQTWLFSVCIRLAEDLEVLGFRTGFFCPLDCEGGDGGSFAAGDWRRRSRRWWRTGRCEVGLRFLLLAIRSVKKNLSCVIGVLLICGCWVSLFWCALGCWDPN